MKNQILETVQKSFDGDITHISALVRLNEHKKEIEECLSLIKDWQQQMQTEIEADVIDNNGTYNGYDIKLVAGRKTYNFQSVQEIEEVNVQKKELESKYKSLFDVYVKTGQNPISEDGEVYDLPSISYGKSHFRITKSK